MFRSKYVEPRALCKQHLDELFCAVKLSTQIVILHTD